jgi:hypothetical protein
MLRKIVGTTAGGGFLSAALAAGWAGVAVVAVIVVVLTGAVCWVVADAERPGRLALLFTALRSRDRIG